VIHGVFEPDAGTDSVRWMDIRVADVAGGSRSLGRIPTTCQPSAEVCFKYVDDSTILTWSSLEYRVWTIGAGGPGRLLLKRDAGPQAVPTVSPNGRWIAVRDQVANGRWSIHVLAADGPTRRTVSLPIPPLSGGDNPHVSDDGSQLIYVAQASGGRGPEVYRVDVASGAATRLRSLPASGGVGPNGPRQETVSPDGQSILFTTALERRGTMMEIDISGLLRPRR
jgi:Tol biopolymer transport system component